MYYSKKGKHQISNGYFQQVIMITGKKSLRSTNSTIQKSASVLYFFFEHLKKLLYRAGYWDPINCTA